jgi:tRNA(fMet)-specific endonuclease VapC
MSMQYLLDTDIFIYIRQKRSPQVLRRFEKLELGTAAISVITFGELLFGAEKSVNPAAAMERLWELQSLLPVLPLPETAAKVYAKNRSVLESEVIGNNDLWIASHAMIADLTLVTNNEREFRRVKGLRIQNWTA